MHLLRVSYYVHCAVMGIGVGMMGVSAGECLYDATPLHLFNFLLGGWVMLLTTQSMVHLAHSMEDFECEDGDDDMCN